MSEVTSYLLKRVSEGNYSVETENDSVSGKFLVGDQRFLG